MTEDLWDKFFDKAEAAMEQFQRMVDLLKECHDILDEYNNSDRNALQCFWCKGDIGYDANGLKHKDDCILVRLRKELNG